jgi:hypothetical protein
MEESSRKRYWKSGKRPGKKLEPWPKTGSAENTSWKPYAPEGVKGKKSSK